MASLSEIIETSRRKPIAREQERAQPGPPRMPNPKVIQAADVNSVMYEQFDAVMEAEGADPRYLAIRAILLEPFSEPTERAMGASA